MKSWAGRRWFCNSLEVAENGEIDRITKCGCSSPKLTDGEGSAVHRLETIASGDSYNDLGMIRASKAGFLFRSTDKIKAENPDIPAYETYGELLDAIKKAMKD